MKDTTAQAVLARLVEATSSSSEAALSGPLNISTQAISDARRRGKIPDSWIRIIADKFNVSADWLFFGRGVMRLDIAHPVAPRATDEVKADNVLQSVRLADNKLEKELEMEREERRELTAENRRLHREKEELHREKEELLRENGELKAMVARLEERKNRLAVATDQPKEASGAA